MTLAEFLLARIAEDEGAAGVGVLYDPRPVARLGGYSPARVLTECEARRRIVERLEPITEVDAGCVCDRCDTLRDLASVYADHPDYRAEWKP